MSWQDRPLDSLPSWAKVVDSSTVQAGNASVCIEADTDGYVKEWLTLLEVDQPTQYWLEVAYQCAKMDLQLAISGTEHDPRTCGLSAEFKFTRAPQWAQSNFEPGRGTYAATKGLEARDHYRRIRGRLPF